MKAVSRFEFKLLRILHCFLGRVPVEQARVLIAGRVEPKDRPKCLTRAAVELVKDALAKGCVELLARAGGWRRERFLRGEHVKEGRLWERTPPRELGLSFSRHTVQFLLWITAAKLGDSRHLWTAPQEELTVGDLYLVYRACGALRDAQLAHLVESWPAFNRNGLVRLAYPDVFSGSPDDVEPDFVPWTEGRGAHILEVLQDDLRERWLELERRKGAIKEWQKLRSLGQAQARVLGSFLDAVERAERLDLARWVLQTASILLSDDVTPAFWVGGLASRGTRMADRMETHAAALVLLHQFDRLRRWERAARSVGYLDEGYARHQLFLADWEHCDGDRLYRRAHDLIQQLDPLHQSGPGGSNPTSPAPA